MRGVIRFIIRLLAPYRKAIPRRSVLAFVSAGLSMAALIALGKDIDLARWNRPALLAAAASPAGCCSSAAASG